MEPFHGEGFTLLQHMLLGMAQPAIIIAVAVEEEMFDLFSIGGAGGNDGVSGPFSTKTDATAWEVVMDTVRRKRTLRRAGAGAGGRPTDRRGAVHDSDEDVFFSELLEIVNLYKSFLDQVLTAKKNGAQILTAREWNFYGDDSKRPLLASSEWVKFDDTVRTYAKRLYYGPLGGGSSTWSWSEWNDPPKEVEKNAFDQKRLGRQLWALIKNRDMEPFDVVFPSPRELIKLMTISFASSAGAVAVGSRSRAGVRAKDEREFAITAAFEETPDAKQLLKKLEERGGRFVPHGELLTFVGGAVKSGATSAGEPSREQGAVQKLRRQHQEPPFSIEAVSSLCRAARKNVSGSVIKFQSGRTGPVATIKVCGGAVVDPIDWKELRPRIPPVLTSTTVSHASATAITRQESSSSSAPRIFTGGSFKIAGTHSTTNGLWGGGLSSSDTSPTYLIAVGKDSVGRKMLE